MKEGARRPRVALAARRLKRTSETKRPLAPFRRAMLVCAGEVKEKEKKGEMKEKNSKESKESSKRERERKRGGRRRKRRRTGLGTGSLEEQGGYFMRRDRLAGKWRVNAQKTKKKAKKRPHYSLPPFSSPSPFLPPPRRHFLSTSILLWIFLLPFCVVCVPLRRLAPMRCGGGERGRARRWLRHPRRARGLLGPRLGNPPRRAR